MYNVLINDKERNMYYLFLGLISVIFIVVFCFISSILILMLADLIAFAWGGLVETLENIFYPIGEWIGETIGAAIKRIIK